MSVGENCSVVIIDLKNDGLNKVKSVFRPFWHLFYVLSIDYLRRYV